MDEEDLSFLEEWNDVSETEFNNNKTSDSLSSVTTLQESKGKGKGKNDNTFNRNRGDEASSKVSEAAMTSRSEINGSRSNSPKPTKLPKTINESIVRTPPLLRGI